MKNVLLVPVLLFFMLTSCAQDTNHTAQNTHKTMDKIVKSTAEWKQQLNPEQYRVLREQGTEPAFSGKYHDHKDKGVYICAGCGNELFHSNTKFRSGTGWPSFYQPVSETNVGTEEDHSFGMIRVEVHCARCDGHLGHVFNDGPDPTGLRYCINSASLGFVPK